MKTCNGIKHDLLFELLITWKYSSALHQLHLVIAMQATW